MMHRARVKAVSGNRVLADGAWLTCIGNRTVHEGEWVWTDGRCVYGHESDGGGSYTPANEVSGIPIVIDKRYYIYRRGHLDLLGEYSPRYLSHREKIFSFFSLPPWSAHGSVNKCVIAADVDDLGNTYAIYGVFGEQGRDFWDSDKIVIKRNGDTLFEIDPWIYAENVNSWCVGRIQEIYPNEDISRFVLGTLVQAGCGFIEASGNWAVFYTIGCAANHQGPITALGAIATYYVTPAGVRKLFYTTGYLPTLTGIVEKTEDYKGCEGVKFPIQDGYYYTMRPPKGNPQALEAPRIAFMTIFTPEGIPIVKEYFSIGTRFTVCHLRENQFLLGTQSRNYSVEVGTDYRGVGWQEYKYPVPAASGIYLCEAGSMHQIATGDCLNFQLRPTRHIKMLKRELTERML